VERAYPTGSSGRCAAGTTTPPGRTAIIGVMSTADRLVQAASARLERVPKDVVPAVVVGFVQVTALYLASHTPHGRDTVDLLAVALVVAGPAALVLRRRAPVAVLTLTTLVALAYWSLDYPRGPVLVAVIVAFVGAVLDGHRAVAWLSLLVGGMAFAWLPAIVGASSSPPAGKVLGLAVWLFLFASAAEVVRAKVERHRDQERVRQQEARVQANQERLRIARELHDVLAHNVSLINVQAGMALHLLDEQPQRARPALEAIKEASSETLGEMRSVLSILRRPGEGPPRSPTVGIAGIGELVARTTAAGIPVETRVSGDPRAVPASVDLAVYRIVQEALTNVARHARPAAAVVRVAYGEDDLTLEIDDEGADAGRVNGNAGNGIAGMRERVTALGGDFAAGPRAGTGFRVRARLPLDART
jgi:signal transduction histidine kinase